ncbi:MAG: NADH-quinone oxidoreductase subunit [Chloroflexota bacterium]|jgi:NADH-quinone oxidoreductase subunit N|nr:NADH-quinone oxidoreductase subunit [Chloroflexota bacterium]
MSATDWGLLAQVLLGATLMVLLLADAFLPEGGKRWLAPIAGVGLLGVLLALLSAAGSGLDAPGVNHLLYNKTVSVDSFAVFFQVLFVGLALMVLLLAPSYLERRGIQRGEFYILLVAALGGMMLMVAATSLMTIFLGIELLSISLYILSAFLRQEERSQEAGLKYLLIGGFATGFLLYGMALLFGGTGSTSLSDIAAKLPNLDGDGRLYSLSGIALILVGVAFKASAAPFHAWTPDVYEGAPAPVVAFMSVGTKVAAIAIFLRIFVVDLARAYPRWVLLLGAIAGLSMIVGAVGALRQTNLKRMLAYSGIAHAGYLMLAVVAQKAGMVAGLFYLAAYGVMTFGAFGIVTLLATRDGERSRIDDIRGLGFRRPALGALLALFMLSLAGIPPTVGFAGKLFVFQAAIRAGYIPLAVIGVLSSAVSLYYYLRVVIALYTPPEDSTAAEVESAVRPRRTDPFGTAAVALAGVLTLALGVFPSVLYELAQKASLL